MKITSTALAWVCVALLVLYPVSAILVWAYLAPESYGIMAALFAANAGTTLFIGLTFRLPEFSGHTSRALRFFVVSDAESSSGALTGYEAELWRMADALRGSMDAAEYKHVTASSETPATAALRCARTHAFHEAVRGLQRILSGPPPPCGVAYSQ